MNQGQGGGNSQGWGEIVFLWGWRRPTRSHVEVEQRKHCVTQRDAHRTVDLPSRADAPQNLTLFSGTEAFLKH